MLTEKERVCPLMATYPKYTLSSTMQNKAVPWHLIGQLAANGKSVNELSAKFHVSPKRIQKRLSLALAQNGHVRTNLEIKQAGHQVKSDLVSVLLKLTKNLASKHETEPKDSVELTRLIDSAQKLFSWPNAKPIDASFMLNAPNIVPAVNLNLIRTSPEELRARAKIIENNDQNDSPKSFHAS
jgi:hypothetical protein